MVGAHGRSQTARRCKPGWGLTARRRGLRQESSAGREVRRDGLSAVFSLAGRGAIFVGMGLFFVQQFVGINAIIYYSTANLPNWPVRRIDVGRRAWTGLLLAMVNVAATLVAIALVDRVGRRPLLLVSLAAMPSAVGRWRRGPDCNRRTGHVLSAAGLYVFVVSFAVGSAQLPGWSRRRCCPSRYGGSRWAWWSGRIGCSNGIECPTGLLLGQRLGLYLLPHAVHCTAMGGIGRLCIGDFGDKAPIAGGDESALHRLGSTSQAKPDSRIMRSGFWAPCPDCSPDTTWQSPRPRWY